MTRGNGGVVRALGLMSGTSLDGIDAALIMTDGVRVAEIGAWLSEPYAPELRRRLRAGLDGKGDIAEIERAMTQAHGKAVHDLLGQAGLKPQGVAIVGFHGQTLRHDPAARFTQQIGDGGLLAALVGIDVINDFRSADVAAGGEGAPFAPLYHAALAHELTRPVGVLNMGGVGNLTWIGDGDDPEIIAFDTGPGGALLDDWTLRRTGAAYDRDGALAGAGRISEAALTRLLDHPYFDRPAPKSLDRNAFSAAPIEALSPADGAATLVAFTAETVARGVRACPAPPDRLLVTGGGRHNPVLMAALAGRTKLRVEAVEAVGWQGDALEAQAFAYLAVRALRGLPLSLPTTTGVPRPLCGGVLHKASKAA